MTNIVKINLESQELENNIYKFIAKVATQGKEKPLKEFYDTFMLILVNEHLNQTK